MKTEAYLMAWWIIFNDTEVTVKWPVAKQWEQTFVKGTAQTVVSKRKCISIYSLDSRPLSQLRKTAWYTLFAHASIAPRFLGIKISL